MSLTRACAGIFPFVSFLHVPKQMPQPQWLVLGTAFLLHVPSLPKPRARAPSAASSATADASELSDAPSTPHIASGGLISRIKQRGKTPQARASDPLLLLSVAHNIAPWRVKEWKLNIPDDWRRLRNIIGNVYQCDAFGACLKDSACRVTVEAMHPTLDLALLSIPDAGGFVRQVATAAAATGDDDDFNQRLSYFRLQPLGGAAAGKELLVDAIGFRGRGSLGDTRIDGEAATKALAPEERHRMVEEHRHAVGKQDVHVFSFVPELASGAGASSALHPTGNGRGIVGSPFIGMSGSPVIARGSSDATADGCRVRSAAGIFYGGELAPATPLLASTDPASPAPRGSLARFVPAEDIIEFLESVL
jgi:hypothetical protein